MLGATYLTKDNNESVYMGKFDFYDSGYQWEETGETKACSRYKDVPQQYKSRYKFKYSGVNAGKRFYFANKQDSGKWTFNVFKNIPKNHFISCIDNTCTSEYVNIYEELQYWECYSPYDKSKDTYFNISIDEFIEKGTYKRNDNTTCYKDFEFISELDGAKRTYMANHLYGTTNEYTLKVCNDEADNSYWGSWKDELTIFPTTTKEEFDFWKRLRIKTEMIPVSLEEIFKKMKPIGRQQYLENGKEYRKVWSMRK